MWPDWVSNPGPLTYESGALSTALRRPALAFSKLRTFLMDSDVLTRIHRTASRISVALESGLQIPDSLRLSVYI